jgi:hypothetical protein
MSELAIAPRKLTDLEWLTTKEAAEYTRRPTVRAFYQWRDRHFVKPAKLYRRVELDQAIARDNRDYAKSGRGLRLAGKQAS